MFHHISKHPEVRQDARRIFNSLLSVWKCDETLSLEFDILLYAFMNVRERQHCFPERTVSAVVHKEPST